MTEIAGASCSEGLQIREDGLASLSEVFPEDGYKLIHLFSLESHYILTYLLLSNKLFSIEF